MFDANRLRILVLAAGAAVLLAGQSAPSAAKIRCDGEYQLNKSGPVRTPYCEDDYLASVARSRGIAVTGAAIRASTGTKRNVCRSLRFDHRVATTCGPFVDQFRRRNPLFLF